MGAWYDPLTFRLSHFKTERTADSKLLQSQAYYYDAVGNIVETVATATQSVYFDVSSRSIAGTSGLLGRP